MRLSRARDGGNVEASAGVAEDVLLGGARGEGREHLKTAPQINFICIGWVSLENIETPNCSSECRIPSSIGCKQLIQSNIFALVKAT